METFVEDAKYQNLALRKAEQKKLNSLKNVNLPWVFVEPTRIKSVKVPKSRKPLNYYEDLDDEDLEFLGNSKVPFTKDDIKILQQSIHRENILADEQDQDEIIKKSHENYSFNEDKQNSNMNEEKDIEKNDQNLNLNDVNEEIDEEIVTSRSSGRATDDLFASDDDKPKKSNREEEKIEVEVETVKNIIMDAAKERAEAEKLQQRKVELNRPISFFSYKIGKTTPEGKESAKERMTLGRRKLLSAISTSSSLKHEEDSLTYARNKFEKENNLKRAALEKCFGARHFKEYLVKQNAEIPKILLNVS